eukprot:Opistho-2@79587
MGSTAEQPEGAADGGELADTEDAPAASSSSRTKAVVSDAEAVAAASGSPTRSRTTKPLDGKPAAAGRQAQGPVRGALLRQSKEAREAAPLSSSGSGSSIPEKTSTSKGAHPPPHGDGPQHRGKVAGADHVPHHSKAPGLTPSNTMMQMTQPPASTVGFVHVVPAPPPARRDGLEGTIVGAMRFDPSKLPSYRVHTKAAIVDSAADSEAARIKAARARRRLMMAQQAQGAGGSAGGPTAIEGHVARSVALTDRAASYQDRVDERGGVPSLIESIQLAPGVTIREGDKVRRGPDVTFVAKPQDARTPRAAARVGVPAEQSSSALNSPSDEPMRVSKNGVIGAGARVKFGGEPLPPVPQQVS